MTIVSRCLRCCRIATMVSVLAAPLSQNLHSQQRPTGQANAKKPDVVDVKTAQRDYEQEFQNLQKQLNDFNNQVKTLYWNQPLQLTDATQALEAASEDLEVPLTASSPLKVRGGSVHADGNYLIFKHLKWNRGQSNCNSNDSNEYCVGLPKHDSYKLASNGFTDGSGGGFSDTDQGKGWVILIMNPDEYSNPTEAIEVCNNPACDPTQAADASRVFLKLLHPDKAELKTVVSGSDITDIYYHYFHMAGDATCDTFTTSHDGPCDMILTATITVQGAGSPITYTCNPGNRKSCVIAIGKP